MPLPADVGESEPPARLYPKMPVPLRNQTPDFAAIQSELARIRATRMLLWQAYRARHPHGCQYSAFCRDYDAWHASQDAVMCFGHTPAATISSWHAGNYDRR